MATGLQHYFGIDFGTTNSATVGFLVMDHKPECVKYGDEEGRPIPSVVAIDKTTGEIYTGRNAWDKKMQLSESCEYISSVKTILDSEQGKEIAGRIWTPVNIATEVFRSLKENVLDRTGLEMNEATIAIPVGFSAEKRSKLREAAEDAGIDGTLEYWGWSTYGNLYGITSDRMYYLTAECLIRTGKIQDGLQMVDRIRAKRVENYEPFAQGNPSEQEAMAKLQRAKWIECIGSYENFFDCKRWNTEANYKRTITRDLGEYGTYTLKPESPLWVLPFPSNVTRYNPSMTQNY